MTARAAAVGKPALQRVCAGEATVLTEAETDLVALVNDAQRIYDTLLDDEVDPNDYQLAEILLELLVYAYGIERRANGDRVIDVESDLRRYLIPFAVEMAAGMRADGRGVAHLRLKHLQHLPRILAGDLPSPAATVAGDRLRRRGAACIWLILDDAATVTNGGRPALDRAVAAGDVPVHTDARTGANIVMALHLRQAGLLIEPEKPHGLAKGSAGNVLRLMNRTLERARTHGADIRFALCLSPIEPLAGKRVRVPKASSGSTPVTTIRTVNALIPVIGQVVLWIARLTGARIGEAYGLLVCDYFRDADGRPWLTITKQGGKRSLLRDPETGALVYQDFKDRTKSPAGVRTIPVPGLLGDLLDRLIEVFHTDPVTGRVDLANRLIPGLGKDDTSGQSSLRAWLEAALDATSIAPFTPHDLRDALITDLKNAGIGERLAHFYAGHEQPNATIQDRHYDLGPESDLLYPLADVLAAKLVGEGIADLRVPTTAREQWGARTRARRRAAAIEAALVGQGWRLDSVATPAGRELTVPRSPPGSAAPSPTPAVSCAAAPSPRTPGHGEPVTSGSPTSTTWTPTGRRTPARASTTSPRRPVGATTRSGMP
jgi:integrase